MGRDLQGAAAAAGGIPGQQLHVDHLDHPRRGGFQVVQQDTGQLLRLQGAHRILHRRAAYKGVLIPQGGQGKGHFLPQQLRPDADRMLLRQDLPGTEEELQCRCLQRGVRAAALSQGEPSYMLRLFRRQQPQGQIAQRIRQGQRGAVVLHLRRLVVRQQCGEELRRFLGITVFQRGGHHQLGGEANVTDLLGRQLVVGIEQQIQILGPQGELGLLHRRLSRRGGQFLLIAQAEFGHHLPHQRRRLTADVPVGMQQQLIEKIYRLDLLIGGQIGGILLQHTQICPHTGPVLLAAGLFQQVGKQSLMAEPAHHVQVVLHRHQAEGAVIGVRRHQGDIRLLLRCRVTALQRYVHAPGAQILLKIPQLPVDVLITALFGGVHMIQLV